MPDADATPETTEPAETEHSGVGSVVEAAREAIEEQRLWVARDLLTDHLRDERDVEALRLLGEVHHGMGDLPAAGAAWFGAGVKGPEVQAAIEAWRADHGDDFGAMWRALPRSVRQEPRSKKVEALRTKALEERDASGAHDGSGGSGGRGGPGKAGSGGAGTALTTTQGESSGGGIDAAQIIAWVIAAFVVACAIVGLVQILRWMVPGS